ncbi:SRPBCC family protein [Nocardia yunnanensis]|uniref:SRPBCC family protein n=1 Tax=Nocardia yunnanensis TaxID=2382165 RepID=A0A386Z4T9_9NOCA|nr:SRPBCC family protein [Nocardia yunnanensis]AYF72802.1 SRPBCC family protein [Nocardia yunnanensis]
MVAEPEITVPVPVSEAFEVIADGWLFALWVVGATHIRDVDEGWPGIGTRIHHSVGLWPLTVEDTTTVVDVHPPHDIELEAALWPFGAARITMTLTEHTPGETTIRIAERAHRGPIGVLPGPLQDLMLVPRNEESLRRLAAIITGRQKQSG